MEQVRTFLCNTYQKGSAFFGHICPMEYLFLDARIIPLRRDACLVQLPICKKKEIGLLGVFWGYVSLLQHA